MLNVKLFKKLLIMNFLLQYGKNRHSTPFYCLIFLFLLRFGDSDTVLMEPRPKRTAAYDPSYRAGLLVERLVWVKLTSMCLSTASDHRAGAPHSRVLLLQREGLQLLRLRDGEQGLYLQVSHHLQHFIS